jgi:PKHD-type hydroxylase
MLLHVPVVLTPADLARCREIVDAAGWVDGRATAGTQSAVVKNNLQLPEASEAALRAREIVLAALQANELFFTGALAKKIVPPLFDRYEGAANAFGNHVDNAVRTVPARGSTCAPICPRRCSCPIPATTTAAS